MPTDAPAQLRRSRRRLALLGAGPVLGALVGTLTNVLTSGWNWWLFSALTVLVGATAIIAIIVDNVSDDIARAEHVPPAAPAGPTGISTLPRDLSDFTGRDAEITDLRARLESALRARVEPGVRAGVESGAPGPAPAVCVIDGMGGVGKTSFALHLAHQIADRFPDATLFINLCAHVEGQHPMSTHEALGILLADLGVPGERIPEHQAGRASLWRRELMHRRVLVVLDNASGADQVRDLIAGGVGCLVMITSRRRMVDLDGVTAAVSLDRLPPADASALFVRIIGADRAAGQHAAIARIVGRLDHLPLAIRLSAGRLRAHPSWTVGDLLDQRISGTGALERIYTLSYRDLDPAHQRFFRLLTAHPGTEITAAAAAVLTGTALDDALPVLDELYDLHLIEEPAHHRFRLHDLIRELAAREDPDMAGTAERQQAMTRLLAYYTNMAILCSARIGARDLTHIQAEAAELPADPPADERDALAWYDAEIGNLLACAHYAIDKELMPYAWRLPAALTSFLRLRGFLGQAGDVLDAALRALTRTPDDLGESVTRRGLGHMARQRGDYPTGREHLDIALGLARRAGDRSGEAWIHHELGHLARLQGDTDDARGNLEAALAIYAELDDPLGEGASRTNLGMVYMLDGDHEAAREQFLRALQIAAEHENNRAQAFAGYQLGALECQDGDYPAARERLNEALARYDRVDNRHGQADCHFHLAIVDRLTGAYDEAKHHLSEALSHYVALGYRRGEADTYAQLAAVSETAGDEAMALVHKHRAEALHRDLGLRAD